MNPYASVISLCMLLVTSSCVVQKQRTEYTRTQDISIEIQDSIYLNGTLEFASTNRLIIIIPGSGPTDRNGNNPLGVQAGSYELLAHYFQSLGISCFRYDKRGIAKSTPVEESTITLDLFAQDLNGIIEYFNSDFDEVILLGHSEGVLIGSMVATKNKAIKSFIAIGGTSIPLDELVSDQYSKSKDQFLVPLVKQHIQEIKSESELSEVHPSLAALFRPSAVPLLKSYFNINPSEVFANVLQDEILLINGSCDIQVSSVHAENLKSANPEAQLVIIQNMGHMLKKLENDCTNAYAAYSNRSLPLHPKLLSTLSFFLKTNDF